MVSRNNITCSCVIFFSTAAGIVYLDGLAFACRSLSFPTFQLPASIASQIVIISLAMSPSSPPAARTLHPCKRVRLRLGCA